MLNHLLFFELNSSIGLHMKTVQKRSFIALAVSAGLGLGMLTGNCFSQEKYPLKTVTLIVPQAAGGANDAIARVIAQKLSEASDQSCLVSKNRF
jgi:tripartite-type tricarboxylate transporter receptor subunit TctC